MMLATLAQQLQAGDRRALAKAITLVESSRDDHREQANQLLSLLPASTNSSLRIGISGAPGVGKSSFIEALGQLILQQQHRLAVLAVDPSSAINGGSILGDKTRMERLSLASNAFIRPSPAGQTLGGVARRSRESILLCEAAGFDVILVETVGVGQSEIAVADMTDLFLLLLAPGAGDELQGIKRGIMELADLIIVNKADGELLNSAQHAVAEYRNASALLKPRTNFWQTQVFSCSALHNSGLDKIWAAIGDYFQHARQNKHLLSQRQQQRVSWLHKEITQLLVEHIQQQQTQAQLLRELELAVSNQQMPVTLAASKMLSALLKQPSAKESNS